MIGTFIIFNALGSFTLHTWISIESFWTDTLSSVCHGSTFCIDAAPIIQARILTTGFCIKTKILLFQLLYFTAFYSNDNCVLTDTGFSIRTFGIRLATNCCFFNNKKRLECFKSVLCT